MFDLQKAKRALGFAPTVLWSVSFATHRENESWQFVAAHHGDICKICDAPAFSCLQEGEASVALCAACAHALITGVERGNR